VAATIVAQRKKASFEKLAFRCSIENTLTAKAATG
jgi:hypothetical protein